MSATAAATVRQQSRQTLDLPDPTNMSADECADYAIAGFQKFNRCLPYVFALKEKVDLFPRDRNNRWKTPFRGCNTWDEFCLKYFDRSRQAINKAFLKSEIPSQASQPHTLESGHPEVNDKANARVRQVSARGRIVRKAVRTLLQELQKMLMRLCASTVDGKEHRLIQLLRELDVIEIAPEETELCEIVVGMLRKIGNLLISCADRLQSRISVAGVA